jgi:hypothetical protein
MSSDYSYSFDSSETQESFGSTVYSSSSHYVTKADEEEPYQKGWEACMATSLQIPLAVLTVFHCLLFAHIELAECNKLSDLANNLNLLLFGLGAFRFLVKIAQESVDVCRRNKLEMRLPPLGWCWELPHMFAHVLGFCVVGVFIWLWIEQGSDSKPFVVTQSVFALVLVWNLFCDISLQVCYIWGQLK